MDGGAGVDTLKLVDVGTTAWTLPAASVKNIENIVITNSNAGVAAVAATPEQQQLVLTGTATATANTSFLGVNTASTANDTAATVAAAIVANKTNILAGAAATAAGITNITANGAVLTLTYGGAGGTGDVANLSAAAASNGITANASAELVKGIAGTSAVAAGADTADARLFIGATNFASENSTGAVNFNNLNATQSVTVRGAAQSGTVTAGWTDTSVAPNITVDGGVNNTTINTATSTATSAVINSTGAANGSALLGGDTFNLTAGATLTKLNVNAATALRATLTAGNFVATGADLVVAGSASNVNLGTAGVFKTVDASGLTAGGVTVNSQTFLTSFVGGAGKDTLTGTAAPASTASIDAGAGSTDTIAATLVNAGNSAVFKNWEIIDTAGMNGTLDASLLTNSTISAISISGAHTSATITGLTETATGLSLNVTGSPGQATSIGGSAASVAGTSDIFNINFAASDKATATTIAANTVTLNKFENLNIVSGGGLNTSNTITITDNDAKAIVVTGAKDLSLTITSQDVSVASVNASQLTSIDASAATGNLTIVTAATQAAVSQSALTIKGGSGNDSITVATSGTGTGVGAVASVGATVTLGGGNDTLNVTGATQLSTTAPQATTVTDLAKGDSIVFTDVGGVTEAFTATKLDVAAATSLVTALAIANAGNATGKIQWFQYGGNTYITEDIGANAANTTDIVVKLSGLIDLSAASLTGQTLTL